ncbi:MAG: hypothetical protein BGN84_10240 [Afipia sp. 62-7]|nr:DUF4102 domain-containing protein [Afipia sp.]OJU17539.1 MAG: hypothetical protein BGN84_10240 [Afipia sp. 62-7]
MSKLSDLKCRKAETRDRLYKLADGGGLQLWVKPNGSKLWCLAYRHNGKQKLLSLGVYPIVTLAAARDARDDARRILSLGSDPSQVKRQRKAAKAKAAANTFNILADEYVAKKRRDGRDPKTLEKIKWILTYARPIIGEFPITDIGAPGCDTGQP